MLRSRRHGDLSVEDRQDFSTINQHEEQHASSAAAVVVVGVVVVVVGDSGAGCPPLSPSLLCGRSSGASYRGAGCCGGCGDRMGAARGAVVLGGCRSVVVVLRAFVVVTTLSNSS